MQDLGQLSDYDFEQVVADVLGAEWQVRVEYFPRGRDSGVDLRVLGPTHEPLNLPSQSELVVQCKHMPGAGMTQLRRLLRNEFAKKIFHEAYRYVLVTSARLTRANKREIVAISNGKIFESDILGRDDVDALLRRHPDVVQANMKLWLASGTALQAFLNQVEHLRSSALQAELEKLRPRFVQTSVVTAAQQVLSRFGVCILAGAPGVGKTTTAKILLLRYLSEGWQPVVAISDARELEAQLVPGVKQILFFDDFLGITALPPKLAKGDDSALVHLVHLVEDDPSKVLILTTRDYILRQAQQAYEKLNDDAFSVMKLVIKINSLTQPERAHILYNQLFFSELRSAAAAAPDGPKRYMALTGHSNYNPRLIEAAIAATSRDIRIRSESQTGAGHHDSSRWPDEHQGDVVRGNSPDDTGLDVPALLKGALDHPERLWEHVLLHQLTQLQREILIARLSLGSAAIDIADFLRVVSNFASTSGNAPTQLALDMALKVLDGDLLSVTRSSARENTLLVNGLNPGVADSLIAMLRRYPDYLQALIASTSAFEQIRWLAEFFGVIVIRPRRRRHARITVECPVELAHSAERNLTVPSIAMSPGFWLVKSRTFSDLGERLEVLSAIYESTKQHSTGELADQIVPQFLRAISDIPNDELVRVIKVLRDDAFRAWRWRRTEVDHAVLGQLDNPDDTEGWSLLRDVLDLVDTTPEYREDLKEQFEAFAENLIMEAFDAIDEANEGEDVDLPFDELRELDDVADRWGLPYPDIEDLLDEIDNIQDRRAEAEAEQRRRERTQNQPTLFEPAEAAPQQNDSIFDHL